MLSSSKPEDVSQNSLEKDGDLDRTAGDIRQDFSGYTDEYAHVYLDTHTSGGRKSFPVWHLINIIIRSRGSSILISRGLRGGSYFKSE